MLKLVLRVGAAFFWRSVNGPVPAAGISDGRESTIPHRKTCTRILVPVPVSFASKHRLKIAHSREMKRPGGLGI
jgi:hypothetical protein